MKDVTIDELNKICDEYFELGTDEVVKRDTDNSILLIQSKFREPLLRIDVQIAMAIGIQIGLKLAKGVANE